MLLTTHNAVPLVIDNPKWLVSRRSELWARRGGEGAVFWQCKWLRHTVCRKKNHNNLFPSPPRSPTHHY